MTKICPPALCRSLFRRSVFTILGKSLQLLKIFLYSLALFFLFAAMQYLFLLIFSCNYCQVFILFYFSCFLFHVRCLALANLDWALRSLNAYSICNENRKNCFASFCFFFLLYWPNVGGHCLWLELLPILAANKIRQQAERRLAPINLWMNMTACTGS